MEEDLLVKALYDGRPWLKECDYNLVTPGKLEGMVRELDECDTIACDLETTGFDTERCDIVGVCLSPATEVLRT